MGRPLNKKFFANTNVAQFGTAGVGGESIASVTAPAGTLATLVNGTYTIPAGSIGAPNITGGAKPVLTVTVTGATAYTVTVVSAGSGYTSAPTITFAGSVAGGTGSATPVATLTSGASARQNGLKCEAKIGSGGSEVTTGDVIKQVNGRSYKVITSDGTAVCKLVTTEAKTANQMSIKATDSAGNTYFVAKLTSRKAVLVPAANVHGGTTTIGSQFASGTTAKWTFGSAVANTTVTIENQ
jgi:hypothetical protein